jgi:hypothetical protein
MDSGEGRPRQDGWALTQKIHTIAGPKSEHWMFSPGKLIWRKGHPWKYHWRAYTDQRWGSGQVSKLWVLVTS